MKHKRRGAQPPDTRAELLAAARRLFPLHGYEGTSIRAITHAARANLGAVTYHFGSKRALYEAVLDEVLGPLVERVAAAVQGPGCTLDRAERAVRAFFEHFEENPEMPKLMLQEVAGGHAPAAPVERLIGAVSARLCELVREGQAAGEIRGGDPALMARSIVSQPVHLTVTERIADRIQGRRGAERIGHAQLVEHAARFARGGLAVAVGGGR